MVEFDKLIVAQHDNQKLHSELPGGKMSVDRSNTDYEMREDIEMALSPRTSTPSQGLANHHGLLTPNATSVAAPSDNAEQYQFVKATRPINPVSRLGQTPDRPNSCANNSPGSVILPEQTPTVQHLIPETDHYKLQGCEKSRISYASADEEMANSPDHMKPVLHPYFRHRGMASTDKVDEAHDALLAHMRTRFRPMQGRTLPVQDATDFQMLPPPSSMLAHQRHLNHPQSKFLTPNFQASRRISTTSRHQAASLSDILAAERKKNHSSRDLAGLSFHHVVQQPFANELRVHVTAGSPSAGIQRGITLYKLQLPVSKSVRGNMYERQTEVWYFFVLSGQPAGEHKVYERRASSEDTILAIPAEDLEENKSEECPLFSGGGQQIQARRRTYTVRGSGRFRLEVQKSDMNSSWPNIRQDLQDGSCRLFTWIEV